MHKEVKQFIKKVLSLNPSFKKGKSVIEFGSLNINGSPRQFFNTKNYLGIDIAEGKGVDYVAFAHEYKPLKIFDVVISTEMLEHDKHWRKSVENMFDLLHSGGLMIITCASIDREEHGTLKNKSEDSPMTNDYYQNIDIYDFSNWMPPLHFDSYNLTYARGKKDLFFWGIKTGSYLKEKDKHIIRRIGRWLIKGDKNHFFTTQGQKWQERYENFF